MHKNALFLLKNCKNRPAMGAPPPDHRQTLPHTEKFWLRHHWCACITDSKYTECISSFTLIACSYSGMKSTLTNPDLSKAEKV